MKLLLAFALFTMLPPPNALPKSDLSAVDRAHGYYSVEHILGQQKDLDKLLIIKKPARDIHDLMKQVAHASGETLETIKQWKTQFPALVAEDEGYPPVEAEARKNIESNIAKKMILSGGTEFERLVLASQLQSTDYLSHVLGVLKETEVNDSRKGGLEKAQMLFEKLNRTTFSVFKRHYRDLKK